MKNVHFLFVLLKLQYGNIFLDSARLYKVSAMMSCRDDPDLNLDDSARDFEKLIVLVNPLHDIVQNRIGINPVLTVHFYDES